MTDKKPTRANDDDDLRDDMIDREGDELDEVSGRKAGGQQTKGSTSEDRSSTSNPGSDTPKSRKRK